MAQVAKDSPRRDVPQLLKDFAALDWYEACISFLFRFAAKTSEPLLALGLIYSAANVLSKGVLSADNQALNITWAISQAVAMESSGGVVLVHGLQAREGKDEVKAWLYFILSTLLAIAGGVMLFMQLAGWEQQGDSPFMLSLFALRCIVSVGYIYLCRAKHIRFSGSEKPVEVPATSVVSDETVQLILAKLAKLDALEQALNAQVVVSEQQGEQELLPAPEGEQGANTAPEADGALPPERATNNGSLSPERATNTNGDRVQTYLEEYPDATVREVAEALTISTSTANKWMNKIVRHEQAND